MYQALLTRRYLTSKVMPLLAALAVMLCTAMVLIVWSVMGGFLTMLLASGRTLIGDVTITWPVSGFPHYGELVERLEADPMVSAATPIIETFGLVQLPDGRVEGVFIKGIEPEGFARVTNYADTVWWKPLDAPLPKDKDGRDIRVSMPLVMQRAYADALRMREAGEAEAEAGAGAGDEGVLRPAVVLGIEVGGLSQREPGGWYEPMSVGRAREDGTIEWISEFMPHAEVTLSVLPLDRRGRTIDVVARRMPVANEFRTGIFEIDDRTVLVDLGTLQRMLKMDAARRFEATGGSVYDIEDGEGGERFPSWEGTGVAPARATTVLVRAADGVTPDALRARAEEVYGAFSAAHAGEVPPLDQLRRGRLINTWESAHATLIGAVKKETALVLFLLGFISMTAVILILSIFWAMVSEKTKDVGVLRAIGAGRAGLAWLWLRYGLTLGILGSAAGGLLALLVVRNINAIHDWMGTALGLSVWDPRVYYFTVIPHEVDTWKAVLVLSGGVLFSVLGAVVPAIRAANMDPVRALRFE